MTASAILRVKSLSKKQQIVMAYVLRMVFYWDLVRILPIPA